MTVDIATLAIRINSLEAQNARRDLERLRDAGGGAERSTRSLTSTFRGLTSALQVLALAKLAQEFVQAADSISLMDARLKLATKSTMEFAQAQRDVYKIAQMNNVGLIETATLYTKLAEPIRSLGGGARETAAIVDAFATTLRISGASTQEAAAATLQFAQAMGSGKLSGDEFRSMAETSPRFMKAMAEGMNVPVGKLKEMAGEGALTADVVGNALTSALATLKKEAETIPDTVGGAFTRMKNDVLVSIGEINKSSSASLGIVGVIEEARKLIPTIRDELVGAFQSLSAFIANNRADFASIWDTAKGIVSDVWEIAKGAASVAGFLFEWGGHGNVIKTALETVRFMLAGVQDGVKIIGAAFAILGSKILEWVLAPLQLVLTASAKIAGVFDDKLAAKINGINGEITKFAGAGAKYGAEVVEAFGRGDSAVGRLSVSMGIAKTATDSAKKSADDAAGAFTKLKPVSGVTDDKASKAAAQALKEEAAAYRAVLKAAQDLASLRQKEDDGIADYMRTQQEGYNAAVKGSRDALKAAQDEYDQYGLSKSQIAEITLLKLESTQASFLEGSAGYDAATKQIEAQRELIEIMRKGEVRDAAKAQFDQMAADAKRMAESIEQSITDGLMRGFESGKSLGQNLIDTLKNMFSTLILRPIVQASVQSGLGIGDASSGGSGFGGAMNLISMGKTLYSGFSGAFASGIGGLIGNLGSMFGSTALSAFGSGMSGTMVGSLAGMGPTVAGSSTGIGAMAGSTAGSAGAGAASMIPIAGWIATGMMAANSLYKQGWDPNNGSINKSTYLAPIAGDSLMLNKIFQGLGMNDKMANLFSGASLVSKLFGRKNPEVESFGIEGTFGAGGFDGKAFQNVLEKGGWFRSDKRYPNTAALDAGTEGSFDSTIKNLMASVQGFGAQMGIEADHISNYTKAIKLELSKDDAKNQELIAKLFGDIGNELATALVPGIAELVKEGEVAATTLARLTTNYAAVDAILFSLGTTFGAVGLDSLKARERLIDLAGGIDNLANGATFFAQNFMSEAERAAPVIKSVKEQMAALGLSGVTTHEQFKNVVLGLDKTTEAGAAQFVAMMQLAEPFHEVTTYMEKLAVEAAAAAPAVETVADAVQAIRSAADGLLGGADAASAVLQRVVDREKSKLTEAHQDAMKKLQIRIDTETAAIAKHKALSDAIKNTLDQMRMPGSEGADRTGAQAQIKAALAIARAGGPVDADSLKGPLTVLAKDSSNLFATMEEYQRDFYRTQNDLADLGKLSDIALSVEEKTLAALVEQKRVAEEGYAAEIRRLDDILLGAQAELDVLRGIDTTLLTIADALKGFGAAMMGANANPIVAATGTISSTYQTALGRAPEAAGMKYWQDQAAGGMSPAEIANLIANSPEAKAQSLYQDVFKRTGDAAGIDYWTKQLSSGLSVDSARDMFKQSDEFKRLQGIPGFVNGGDHMGGLRWVGEVSPELEATGPSRIHSTRDLMKSLRSPSGNNEALAAAVDRLTKQVAEQQAALDKIANNTRRSADTLDVVTEGGEAMRTTT